jgi:hypothetical protein
VVARQRKQRALGAFARLDEAGRHAAQEHVGHVQLELLPAEAHVHRQRRGQGGVVHLQAPPSLAEHAVDTPGQLQVRPLVKAELAHQGHHRADALILGHQGPPIAPDAAIQPQFFMHKRLQ